MEDKIEKYRLKCFWGTEMARWAEEHSYEELENEPGNEMDITVEIFNTEGKVQAFILGVNKCQGWDNYLIHEMI